MSSEPNKDEVLNESLLSEVEESEKKESLTTEDIESLFKD